MTSLSIDRNEEDASSPSSAEGASADDLIDSIDAKIRVIVVHKVEPIGDLESSEKWSPVELATMFRTLEGFDFQLDEQQKPRILGTGGFGEVYLATERELNRPVAIKVLKPQYAADREQVLQFHLEGVLTSRLQHPGIPPVHAMGLWHGSPAIVMKVVVGKTLTAYLSEQRRLASLSTTKVVDYFLQASRAVAYAHTHNTLHLDLKPANVMIGAQDEIQVMDWGLGRLGEGKDQSAQRAGTPAYMPPEQANGNIHEIAPHSDVFSLGAMLTEILTGKPPYIATSKAKAVQMAMDGDLADAIQRLNTAELEDPSLAPLTGLARWCLSEDPAMRPRDAGMVVNALTRYQEGLRLQVQQEIADRARREQQAHVDRARFRARATILGTVALIMVVVTTGAVWSMATIQARNSGFESELAKIDQLIKMGSASAIDEARRDFAIVESHAAEGWVNGPVKQLMQAAKADLDFIEKRDEARQNLAEFTNGLELNTGTALQYGALFEQYGIIVKKTDDAVKRIRSSRIQAELLAGLDHWALVSDDIQKPLLWQVAKEASQPGWSQEFRTPTIRDDPQALKRLVTRIPWGVLSADEFESAARGLTQQGLRTESLDVLRKAVRRFPNDFWLNLLLGQEVAATIAESAPLPIRHNIASESISYLRAALAIKENAHVYSEMARVSIAGDDLEAAEVAANQALKMDVNAASARFFLAKIRIRQNKPREAASIARQALEMVKAQSPVQQSQWVRRLNELIEETEAAAAGM